MQISMRRSVIQDFLNHSVRVIYRVIQVILFATQLIDFAEFMKDAPVHNGRTESVPAGKYNSGQDSKLESSVQSH